MFTTGLGMRADRVILDKLREINDAGGRYNNRGAFIESNEMGDGFYLERGGIWNDTEGRVLAGTTKTDVRDVIADLKRLGIEKTFEEVDALLSEAVHIVRSEDRYEAELFAERQREFMRAERRVRIARLREQGKCIMCGSPKGKPERRPLVDPSTGKPKSTCPQCAIAANKRAAKREVEELKQRKRIRDMEAKRIAKQKPH